MLLNIFVRTALYSALVALAFAPLESISPQHNRVRNDYKRDVGYALLGATAAQLLALWLMGLCLTGAEYFGFSEGPLHAAPTWVSLITSILWVEFSGYGYHRSAHHIPLLWKLHKTHHSSETMDWLASFRQHPVEIALMTLVQNVPLVLLGLSLSEHTLLILVLRLNTVFVHANIRVPLWWPGALFATPAFHHRHHALSGSTTNFASLFPWIDRIFGSFSAETATTFGLARASQPTAPLNPSP